VRNASKGGALVVGKGGVGADADFAGWATENDIHAFCPDFHEKIWEIE